MKRKRCLWGFFIIVSLATAAHAAPNTEALGGLDEFVEQAMKASGTPGIAVSVVSGDQTVISRGYGLREAGKAGRVDENTLFAIGSNTKYFTATALGLLVEEGKLNWDESLTRYLPGLRFSDPYLFTGVNLREALSHRTGLERADLAWYANPDLTREEVLRMGEMLSLELPYRSGYLYNNFMYLAAGQVIPAVTGQSWDDFVKERILAPLGMDRSNTSTHDLEGMENVASPHAMVDGRAVAIPYYNLDHLAPAGSINSSVSDMAKWCKAQLADGQIGDPPLIPQVVIDEVRKPHNLLTLAGEGHVRNIHGAYGLGIARANYGPTHVAYMHTGGIDGMLSVFAFIPDASICAVALSNSDPNYGLETSVLQWILDHMLELNDKDYMAEFNEKLQEQKDGEVKVLQQHETTHDENLAPSLERAGYANSYRNELYGELLIEASDAQLSFSYGSLFRGRLKHHRNDSFDAVHDQAVRNSSESFLVSFSLNASGEAESALLETFGENPLSIRFIAVPGDELPEAVATE